MRVTFPNALRIWAGKVPESTERMTVGGCLGALIGAIAGAVIGIVIEERLGILRAQLGCSLVGAVLGGVIGRSIAGGGWES